MVKRKLINKKAKLEIDRYPLVEVRWTDVISEAGWQPVRDVIKSKLPECVTKGHLLSQSKGVTRIFGDFSKGKEEGSIDELANSTLIPNSIIISIKKIKKGRRRIWLKRKKLRRKKRKKRRPKRENRGLTLIPPYLI